MLYGAETCDDGNTVSGDGCSSLCLYENPPYYCFTSGHLSGPCWLCGDGILSSYEKCDDGNHVSGDGCNYNCSIVETGYYCVGGGYAC